MATGYQDWHRGVTLIAEYDETYLEVLSDADNAVVIVWEDE